MLICRREHPAQESPEAPYSVSDGSLQPWEVAWRDRFDALKAKGYVLRPRFRPDWQPSWIRMGLGGYERYLCEDFLHHNVRRLSEVIEMSGLT